MGTSLEAYNDGNHSDGAFATNKQGRTHENNDGHGDSGECERELDIFSIRNDDDELDRKSEEEEEIEFEKGDVDL